MDSCHIFNFIFGTKKATDELSRCFSNISENITGTRSSSSSEHHNSSSSSSSPQRKGPRQPPKSPLKQLQNKLVNLVSKVHSQSNENDDKSKQREEFTLVAEPLDSRAELVNVQSGTYKATLVRASSDEIEEDVKDAFGEPNCIVVNPIHNDEDADDDDNDSDADGERHARAIEVVVNPMSQLDDAQHGIESNPINIGQDKLAIQQNELGENIETIDDKQTAFRAERIVLFEEENETSQERSPKQESIPERNDKRSLYVRNLVRSIESGSISLEQNHQCSYDENENINKKQDQISIDSVEEPKRNQSAISLSNRRGQYVSSISTSSPSKPTTFVKPLPPKAPPKSFRAKCLRHQLSLNKPTRLQQLFQDEKFLAKFFDTLEPLERCVAAQICRKWRDVLYSDHKYWKGLINVIDCTQLRREHLVECIVNTLQSAKLKQQQQQQLHKLHDVTSNSASKLAKKSSAAQQSGSIAGNCFELPSEPVADNELVSDDSTLAGESKKPTLASDTIYGFDQEEVWRIQELCNRFALQKHSHSLFKPQSDTCNGENQATSENQHQQQPQICSASKSSSIPSQISSTFSSASLSSILSPLSESSRVESMKEKLYTSIDSRGFKAICLFGATDDDIEDLVCKIPSSSHERITIARLNNCSITNCGLERFISSFLLLNELELTGCNELTNAFDLSPLTKLRRLIITDCINIADGLAQKLMLILPRLSELTIQAYHLTDAFIEFLSLNCDTSKLKSLELPNCKEITNQSVILLAKHFSQLEVLSLSGSTKISYDGIEILAEQASNLRSLDLSWCPRVTDASLECIACELSDTLTHLALDR